MGAIDDLRRFESDWHRATTARDKGIGSERAPEPLVKVESDGWKYTVRLNTDVPSSIASARSVHTIFTNPGSENAANSAGGRARKVTFASHGFVTAPMTIWRRGTSASTPQPSD